VSLDTASSAYRMAFGAPVNLFDEPLLRLLELVRNLMVHDAGEIKQKFKDDLERKDLHNHSDCQNIEIGKLFPLDGAMVSRFARCVTDAAASLIKFVDQYLQSLDNKNKLE